MRNSFSSYVVVLAGGVGKRVQPVSTVARPKQFISLSEGGSTFQAALRRALRVVNGQVRNIVIVTESRYVRIVQEQSRHLCPAGEMPQILTESFGRGTCFAVLAALLYIRRRVRNCLICLMPADHVIHPEVCYVDRVKAMLLYVASQQKTILLAAVAASFFSTEYGILLRGCVPQAMIESVPVYAVRRFLEKPPILALRALGEDYWWYIGVPVFHLQTMLRYFEQYVLPRHHFDAIRFLKDGGMQCIVTNPRVARYCGGSIDEKILTQCTSALQFLSLSINWVDIGSMPLLRRHMKAYSEG